MYVNLIRQNNICNNGLFKKKVNLVREREIVRAFNNKVWRAFTSATNACKSNDSESRFTVIFPLGN